MIKSDHNVTKKRDAARLSFSYSCRAGARLAAYAFTATIRAHPRLRICALAESPGPHTGRWNYISRINNKTNALLQHHIPGQTCFSYHQHRLLGEDAIPAPITLNIAAISAKDIRET